MTAPRVADRYAADASSSPLNRRRNSSQGSRRYRRQLGVERLEARRVLAAFIVDTFTDSATGICGVDGAGNNRCTLRSAIIAANNRPGADSIRLPAGVYDLSIPRNGSLPGPGDGDLDITDSLTITGSPTNPGQTVIDANQLDRVFTVSAAILPTAVTAILSGLTIQGGLSPMGLPSGGIDAGSNTNLEIRDTIVRNNRADTSSGSNFGDSDGGGIGTSGNLLLNNASVINNSAEDFGGGIAMLNAGTLSITNSVISNNTSGNQGGGIWAGNGLNYQITISQSTIRGNESTNAEGGGLYVDGGGSAARVTLNTVVFDTNKASLSGGGAYLYKVASVTQTGGSYLRNESSDAGGGLYVLENGAVSIDATTFTNNTSVNGGGGISILTDATIRNALFQQNSVTGVAIPGAFRFDLGGGGIGIVQGTLVRPTVTIQDSSILNNTAPLAGGIGAANANVTIVNSTIDGNQSVGTVGGAGGIGLAQDDIGGVAANRVRLTVTNSTISNNTSAAEAGGIGIADANATLTGSEITGNSTTGGRGGGIGIIGLSNNPTLTVVRSTIDNNQANGDGGGIAAADAGFFVSNSTISNNTSGGNGGGIAFANTVPTLTGAVEFSTIASNRTTGFGSNVAVNGSVTRFLSSIVSDPLGSAPLFNFVSGGPGQVSSQGFNLVSDNSSSFASGGDLINVNPNLAALADNGGPVRTRALSAGSRAIDAGANAPLTVDARNFPRPVDGDGNGVARNDIGSFERAAATVTVTANNSPLAVTEDVTATLNLVPLVTVTGSASAPTFTITTQPARGTATLVGGMLTYRPVANDFTTTPLTLVYTARVGTVSDPGTITINIASINDPPVFTADPVRTTPAGTPLSIPIANLLANDTVGPANEVGTPAIGIVNALTSRGSSAVRSGGNIVYTPRAGVTGNDVISYTITDGRLSANATVTVNVTAGVVVTANNSPLAVTEDTTATLNLRPLVTVTGSVASPTFTLTTQAARGMGSINGTTLTYVPAANDFTTTPLTLVYTATVGAVSDVGTITINIAPVNDPPVANNDTVNAVSGAITSIPFTTLLANDTRGPVNENSQTLTITSVTQPANGSVSLNATNLTYTAPAGFVGTTSFTYTATDSGGATDTASVTVNVAPAGQATDLAVSLFGPTSAFAGENVTYFINVFNNGPNAAVNVSFRDVLPAGLTLVSGTAGSATVTASGQTVTANLGTINSGQSVSITIVAFVASNATGSFTNTVSVSSTTADSVLANNVDSLTTSIDTPPILHTLTTGLGDGGVTLQVDSFGVFGSGAFNVSSVASYDPVGVTNPAPAVFESFVAFRTTNVGTRQPIGDPSFSSGPPNGATLDTAVSGTTSRATSRFRIGNLIVNLVQRVEESLDSNGARIGSRLIQTYSIANPSASSTTLDLVRFNHADLLFDGSANDGGGVLFDATGKPTLFVTDPGSVGSSSTTFVGIDSSGGQSLATDRFTVDGFSQLSNLVFSGQPLQGTITGDLNGDGFIDVGQEYDVALALRNLLSIAPGQSATYETTTMFGNRPDSIVPQTSSTISGRVSNDMNRNGTVESGEELPGVKVFIDADGDRLLDPNEQSTTTDSNGRYLFPNVRIPSDRKANVVVQNPPSGSPITPEIGVTRSAIPTGNLSRALAATDFDRDGDNDLLVVNELGNDISVLLNDNSGRFVPSTPIQLGKRPQAISVWQATPSSAPVVAVAAVGTVSDKGSIYVVEGSSVRELSAGNGPVSVVVNDLNGDGKPDFVAASFRSGTIVSRMSGESNERILATARSPRSVISAQVNNDSFTDLIVVATGFEGDDSSEIIVLLGDGKGNFTPVKQTLPGRGSVDVAAANFDSDSADEIVIAGYNGTVNVYDFVGGKFQVIDSVSTQVGVESVAVQDVNSDGKPDLVFGNVKSETIELFINTGSGFVRNKTITGVASPSDVVIANLDNDSILDVAVSNLYGRTSPNFSLPSTATVLGLTVTEREVTLTANQTSTANFMFLVASSTATQTNSIRRFDVDNSGSVTARDALVVINSLRRQAGASGESTKTFQLHHADVNGDGKLTASDALQIINHMARQTRSVKKIDGESFASPIDTQSERTKAIDTLMSDESQIF